MKKIAVIGASRGVGLLVVKEALERGNQVRALARGEIRVSNQPGLEKINGSATSVEDVKSAIAGADAIVVAIGTGTKIDWATLTQGAPVYPESMVSLIAALREMGMEVPVILLTGFGSGESARYQPLVMGLLMKALLGRVYSDKSAMERMLVENHPSWVIARPARLTDGPLTGSFRKFTALAKGMKVSQISRADVAHYLVSEAESAGDLGKYVTLTD